MKKAVMVIVVMASILPHLFSMGIEEKTVSDTRKIGDIEKSIYISKTYDLSNLILNITIKSKNAYGNRVLFRLDDKYFYSWKDQNVELTGANTIYKDYLTIEDIENPDPGNFVDITGLDGTYLEKQTTAISNTKNSYFQIRIPHGYWDKDFVIVIMYQTNQAGKNEQTSWLYEYYHLKLNIEFFEGENDIFASFGEKEIHIDMKSNRALLLQAAFRDALDNDAGLKVSFDNALDKFNIDRSSFNTYCTRIKADNELLALVDNAKYQIKKIISNSLDLGYDKKVIDGREITFPYLNLGSSMLNGIYGAIEGRNIYFNIFLYMCYSEGKPVLENRIWRALDGRTNYNYRQYALVNNGSDMAKAAGMYLTWGVEYTPLNISDNYNVGISGNKVYNDNREMIINQWIKNTDTNKDNTGNNYLPYQPFPIREDEKLFDFNNETPKKAQILNPNATTNILYMTTQLTGTQAQISRIDIWNSGNIVWNNNIIDKKAVKIGDTEITDNNITGKINDKKIFLEKYRSTAERYIVENENSLKNMHLKRLHTNDRIEIGYDFKSTEEISGLLLVRGFSSNHSENNIALGKTAFEATVNDDYPQYAADKVNNGKDNDGWKSRRKINDEWVYIDLENTYEVEKIELNWACDRFSYLIQTAPDGSTEDDLMNKDGNCWTTIKTVQNERWGKRTYLFYNDVINARYIRIKGVNLGSATNYYLMELEAFKKNIKIVSKTTSNSEWGNVTFKDVTASYEEDKYIIYPDYKGKNIVPGNSIIDPVHSRSKGMGINDNVVYSYLLFYDYNNEKYTSINSKAFRIIDDSGNAFMNISELMVFEKNPVSYITEVNENLMEIYNDRNKWGNVTKTPVYLNDLKNKKYRNILFNRDPGKGTLLSASEDHLFGFIMDSGISSFIDTIAIWEPNAIQDENYIDNDSDTFLKSFSFLGSANGLLQFVNFENSDSIDAIESTLKNTLKTPFKNKKDEAVIGNSIPFVAYGIDSPRTFAYKMHQQTLSRNWYNNIDSIDKIINTTSAESNAVYSYWDDYVSETDMFRKSDGIDLETNENGEYSNYNISAIPKYPNVNTLYGEYANKNIKPFMPNLVFNNNYGGVKSNNSLYYPGKTAGVDSTGLLLGTAAISGIDNLLNINNKDIVDDILRYYKMSSPESGEDPIPGLDGDGLPEYYQNSYDDYFDAIGASDIEKMTVLVPDISLIQKGDLLVNWNVYGSIHIGIVIDTLWGANTPSYGSKIEDYWDKVLVVSTRRGLQNTSVGVWGNNNNVFGGFTTEPEKYQIRRLLRCTVEESELTNKAQPDSWEFIEKMPVKKRDWYTKKDCPTHNHPLGSKGSSYDLITNSLSKNAIPYNLTEIREENGVKIYDSEELYYFTIQEQIKEMAIRQDTKYCENFPPTSYNIINEDSLFRKPDGTDDIMLIGTGGLSGWRGLDYPYSFTKRLWFTRSGKPFDTNIFFNENQFWEVKPEDKSTGIPAGLRLTEDSISGKKCLSNNDFYGLVENTEENRRIPFEVYIEFTPQTEGDYASIIFDYRDDDNYYLVTTMIYNDESNEDRLFLYRIKDGEYTLVEKLGALFPTYIKKKNYLTLRYDGNKMIIIFNHTRVEDLIDREIEFVPDEPIKGRFGVETSKKNVVFNTFKLTVSSQYYSKEIHLAKQLWFTYHMANDLYSSQYVDADHVRATGEGWDIYAPEDGEFWVYHSDSPQRILLPGNNRLNDCSYYNDSASRDAGLIGILITNPVELKEGRVYLFCHMGSKQEIERELQYKDLYILYGYDRYPKGEENRIPVKKGDWIGKVGIRGTAGSPHIHFEVFEYFKEVLDENDNNIVLNDPHNGWKRVEPKSIFEPSIINADGATPFKMWERIARSFNYPGKIWINNEEHTLENFQKKEFREWYLRE
ncbi:MAG: discoidin domain-containing protein [Spirochaetales bacterium]|nr:discoidin domain-containing protein [Spirochaetales bacterium]